MKGDSSQNFTGQPGLAGSPAEFDLIEAAKKGDVDAFGQLYGLYVQVVYRYIAYRVRPAPEVEDLTAQVFLNAWKAIERYQHQSTPFLAWLYTIAHNLVINHGKSKNQNTVFTPIDEAYHLADQSHYNNPDQQADKKVEFEALRQAVLQLPDDQQQVIYLRYVEELSHAQIATLMSKTEVTVRGILFRAHETLRKLLKRESIFGEAN